MANNIDEPIAETPSHLPPAWAEIDGMFRQIQQHCQSMRANLQQALRTQDGSPEMEKLKKEYLTSMAQISLILTALRRRGWPDE